jgi:YD repeat-containing protein
VQTQYADGTVTRSVYDAAGRVSVTTDRFVPGTQTNGSRTIYDLAGRVTDTQRLADVVIDISTIDIDDGLGTIIGRVSTTALTSTGAVLSTTSTHYNALGQVDHTIDASDQRTDYAYDALGRQQSVTQPETSIINPLTGLSERVRAVTSYTYDGLGRQHQVTGPAPETSQAGEHLRRRARRGPRGTGHSPVSRDKPYDRRPRAKRDTPAAALRDRPASGTNGPHVPVLSAYPQGRGLVCTLTGPT